VRVTLKEIDRWMTRITDAMVNTSTKLNQVADLDLVLGRKLDRLAAGLSGNAEQKINRLSEKIDKLADLPTSAQNKLDGAAEKIERLGSSPPPLNRGLTGCRTRSISWRTSQFLRTKSWTGWPERCSAAKGNDP